MKSETKNCQNCKSAFVIEPDDFAFYEKMKVPAPTFCSECRLIRRLAWRNEKTFYRRNCDKCKKPGISVFSPETKLTVYCSPCWWSDSWEGLDYGADFDPARPFLLQVRGLLQKVPMPTLFGLYTTLENSDYTNMVSYLKNCYMVTYSDFGENLTYGSFVNHSKDSVDNLMLEHGELCYENINCSKSFQTLFSVDCESCTDVYFSKNCVGCNDCFGCANLRKKKYHIFNKPYSKEEYEKIIKDMYPSTPEKIENAKAKAQAIWAQFPQKYMHGWRNVGSTGDYLNDTKNAKDCFIGFGIEDSRFCSLVTAKLTDTYDFTNFGLNSSLLYEVLQGGNQVTRALFSWWAITSSSELEYCMFTDNVHNLFGCVGLKKKEYCILNRQYSKEEYFDLRKKIIGQMNEIPYVDAKGRAYKYGEFFPSELSPFGYNETTAQEFFPLTQEEAKNQGYNWRKLEDKDYNISKKHSDLPAEIKDVDDSIINETISCAHEGRCGDPWTTAFKIIPQELQFYKKMNLPLPRLCLNCRHYDRLKQRNPLKLWHRKCAKCPNEFETTYAPDRKEIIYCETCYQQEVG